MKTHQYFTLALAAGLTLLTTPITQAEEIIQQGDFGSLTDWNPFKNGEVDPKLDTANSTFTDVYPDNSSSVQLTGQIERVSPSLKQKTAQTIYSGKAIFDIDICPLEKADDPKWGWKITVTGGENQEATVCGILISSQVALRETGKQGSVLLRDKFDAGQWYHFTAEINLDTKTWSGKISGANGVTDTFTDQPIDNGAYEISGVSITTFGKANQKVHPIRIDNVSVKTQ